jgi:hypothetical protein
MKKIKPMNMKSMFKDVPMKEVVGMVVAVRLIDTIKK